MRLMKVGSVLKSIKLLYPLISQLFLEYPVSEKRLSPSLRALRFHIQALAGIYQKTLLKLI